MHDSVRVGDRVVIRAVRNARDKRFIGVQGEVEHCYESGKYFAVRTDGNVLVIVTAVDKGYSTDRPLTASERALYAAENHSWRDEEAAVEKLHRYGIIGDETLSDELRRIDDERRRTAPDKKRTQAMEFARRILGADADLDDLLRLAEWILDNPDASAKDIKRVTTAEAEDAPRLDFSFLNRYGAGEFVVESQETPRPPANLEIRDKDGDCLHLAYTHTLAGIVAVIDARSHGDVCATYVNAEDADRIIAFLQAAKAAKA